MPPRARPKLLLPRNDAVFKLLLVRNPKLLRSMLQNVLGRRIAKLTLLSLDFALPSPKPVIARVFHSISGAKVLGLAVLALRALTPESTAEFTSHCPTSVVVRANSRLNPELPAEGPASKAITLDILVELADGTRVDVEMQVQVRPGFTGRAVYYLARNFTEPLRRGQDYGTLRPSVLVLWAVEPLFAERDGFHVVYELRDGCGNRFSEHLAIHVLELSKLRDAPRPSGTSAEARSARALRRWGSS